MGTDRDAKLVALHDQLREKRDRLHKRVRDIHRDQQHEDSDLDKDQEDQAIQLENNEVLDVLEPATRVELQNVLAALERAEEGDYGDCVDCGDEIDIKRLEALPHASRCIGCAEQQEGTAAAGTRTGAGSREQMNASDFGEWTED